MREIFYLVDSEEKPKAPPRKRNKDASKRTLIKAAVALFSEMGFNKATTSAIAKKAKLNEQLITRYFGGKNGLLKAVFSDYIQLEENDKAYSNLPPSTTVKGEIENYLMCNHKQFIKSEKHLKIILPQLILDKNIREELMAALTNYSSPILEARLTVLQKHDLIADHVNIKDLVLTISCHIFSMSFLIRLITNTPSKIIEKQLLDYAAYLIDGISKK